MENQTNIHDQGETTPPMRQKLPNASTSLVLGILSILFLCCCGPFGLIPAIIALVLASKDSKLYYDHPEFYTESSFSNLQAGRVTAIIAIVLSVISIGFILFFIVSEGGIEESIERYQELLEEIQRME